MLVWKWEVFFWEVFVLKCSKYENVEGGSRGANTIKKAVSQKSKPYYAKHLRILKKMHPNVSKIDLAGSAVEFRTMQIHKAVVGVTTTGFPSLVG